MLERYLLIWLCILSWLAYQWSDFSIPFDPFIATATYLKPLFAVTMLAVGWLLPRDELRQVAVRWKTVLSGTAIQYLSMPAIAYAVASVFGLPYEYRIGTVMAGCVPGAMASNVLTLVAKGNVSYSLCLTTSATLLSPVVVPLAMSLFLGETVSFSPLEVSWELCWMVVMPVVSGHLLARRFPGWLHIAKPLAFAIANLSILWIIAVVVGVNRERIAELDKTLFAALLSLNLGGYTVGFLAGLAMRLPLGMRRALTLEIGMQNAGLGVVLVSTLFSELPAAQIPAAIYTFGCMLTGTMLARTWAIVSMRRESSAHPETA